MAYFQTNGKISDNILGNLWRQINQEFLPQSQYDKCGLPLLKDMFFGMKLRMQGKWKFGYR
ncbi:MAG: hypothetical protein ACLRMZ_03695 [Blautia marasmi]